MKVMISGATGFIGRVLCLRLVEKGHTVTGLTRDRHRAKGVLPGEVRIEEWDGRDSVVLKNILPGTEAVINLAGENIGEGQWTAAKKKAIFESRIQAGKAFFEAISSIPSGPGIFIQASAIGFYGNRGEEPLDESSSGGTGFLADICREWEVSTAELGRKGIRVAIVRTGVVLGWEGGVLPKLLLPFKFFAGGHLGSGNDYFSWIHIQDEIDAICFILEKDGLSGVFNLTAPEPVQKANMARIIGRIMHRPWFFPVPSWILSLALGERARELILNSQRVIPRRLQENGYPFVFRDFSSAITELMHKHQ